ncbi:MAG: PIN domain nuclease, partial [Bacteroidota bacterium]
TIPLGQEEIYEAYAKIDAFSRGHYSQETQSKKFSSIKMGKNDLWIAATTAVVEGTLITTDKDFAHLDQIFFQVKYVQQ